jgi:hypothetical protein
VKTVSLIYENILMGTNVSNLAEGSSGHTIFRVLCGVKIARHCLGTLRKHKLIEKNSKKSSKFLFFENFS